MSRTSKRFSLAGLLVLAGLLAFAADADAQAQQAYYYPSAGTYATTAGPVYVPAPGYYYNVPAQFAPTAPAFNAATEAPGTGRWLGFGRTTSYRGAAGYRPSGGTPYYQGGGSGGTPHYLHGRGIDSSGHR